MYASPRWTCTSLRWTLLQDGHIAKVDTPPRWTCMCLWRWALLKNGYLPEMDISIIMMDASLRWASLLDGYIAKSENDSKMDFFIKHWDLSKIESFPRWTLLWDVHLSKPDISIGWKCLWDLHFSEMDTSPRWTPLKLKISKMETCLKWVPHQNVLLLK